jgi:hypothetical protein
MPSFCNGESGVGLFVAAVIGRLVRWEFALAVPRFGQHRKVPDGIHLGALRAGLSAHCLLAVEGVNRAGDADGRPILVAQRHTKRRLRHGVRAQIGNLIRLRLGVCEGLSAALPGGGPERIGHPELVADSPPRRMWCFERRPRTLPRLRPRARTEFAKYTSFVSLILVVHAARSGHAARPGTSASSDLHDAAESRPQQGRAAAESQRVKISRAHSHTCDLVISDHSRSQR